MKFIYLILLTYFLVEVQLLPFGQNTGGSIIGITPGIAMMQTSSSDNAMMALGHGGKR